MDKKEQVKERIVIYGSIILGGLLPYVLVIGFLAAVLNFSDAPTTFFNPMTTIAVVYLLICTIFYSYVLKEAEPGTRWQTFLMHMGIGLLAAVIFFVIGSLLRKVYDPF